MCPEMDADLVLKLDLPPGDPYVQQLLVDDANIYWGLGSGVFAMPKAGGPARTITSIPTVPPRFSLVEPGYLHAANNAGPTPTGEDSLVRFSRDATNGTPETVSPDGVVDAAWMTTLGGSLYLRHAHQISPGAADFVALDPHEHDLLYRIGTVATDGTSLYWQTELYWPKTDNHPMLETGRWLRKLTPPSTTPVDLVVEKNGLVAQFPTFDTDNVAHASSKHLCVQGSASFHCYSLDPWGEVGGIKGGAINGVFALDEPYLYRFETLTYCGGILRTDLTTGDETLVWSYDVNNPALVQGLALDQDNLYWAWNGSIYRKQK